MRTALRSKHRRRACFYGRREVLVRIRVNGLEEFVAQMNGASRSIDRTFRPARHLQRFADNVAGEGRKWKNR